MDQERSFMAAKIDAANLLLKSTDCGHLPLKHRVELAGILQDPAKINKVLLACCKAAYNKVYVNDQLLFDLISKIDSYLYANEQFDFRALFDQNKNYAESLPGGPHADLWLACLDLSFSIYSGASKFLCIDNYAGQDDNSADWESCTSDYFASNAYAAGNPFLNQGSRQLRIEFWTFYLEAVMNIFDDQNSVIVGKLRQASDTGIVRKRTKEYNDEFIQNRMRRVVDLVLKDLCEANTESEWHAVEIEGQNIGGLGMKGFYIDKQGVSNRFQLNYYLYNDEQSTVKIMDEIKNHIYEQSPKEGTWISYKLTIYSEDKYYITYNFDNARLYEDKEPNFEPFIEEFKKYPRAEEFTPVWWRDIINKNGLKPLL